MQVRCSCVVAATLWCAAAFGSDAAIPTARASTPPDNPAPQAQTHAPAAAPAASDERCRLATRTGDGVDPCPPPDDDHDGINDGLDQCPDTTPGVDVDATGCARPGPNG